MSVRVVQLYSEQKVTVWEFTILMLTFLYDFGIGHLFILPNGVCFKIASLSLSSFVFLIKKYSTQLIMAQNRKNPFKSI